MKCAGTTISRHLSENYNEKEILLLYQHVSNLKNMKERSDVRAHILSLPAERRKKIKVIIGHRAYYGIDKLFPEKEPRYVVFLRNPFNRTISHYNFERTMLDKGVNMERHRNFLFREGRLLSLKEWFFANKVFQNFTFRFLFSHFFSDESLSITDEYFTGNEDMTEKNLEKIKAALARFYFVGITEKGEDMLFLYYQLGMKKFFGRENVSGKYLKNEEIKKAKEYMLPCLEFDQKIYDYALKTNVEFKKRHQEFRFIVFYMRLRSSLYFMQEWLFKISAKLKKHSKIYKKFVEIVKKGRMAG